MKRRVIAIVLATLVCVMVALTVGCTHKFTCGMCNKEVNEAGHKVTVMGKEIEICDECNKKYEAAKTLAGGLMG